MSVHLQVYVFGILFAQDPGPHVREEAFVLRPIPEFSVWVLGLGSWVCCLGFKVCC